MKKTMVLLLLVLTALFLIGCQPQEAVQEETTHQAQQEPAQEAVQEATEQASVKTTSVQILGPDGFDTDQLTIRAGEALSWTNANTREKDVTLTIQKEGTRDFITSDVLKVGESFSHTFSEPGTYSFWTVGYGVFGEVVVN